MNEQYNLIPGETALLVIDMQNSWCHPQGSIGRNGYDAPMILLEKHTGFALILIAG